MRLAVCSIVALIAFLSPLPAFPDARMPGDDPYEIRPPDEQYLDVYEEVPDALLLNSRVEEELGGRWQIGIWDQYSKTAKRVGGSGVDIAPEGLEDAQDVETAARGFIEEHPEFFGNPSLGNLRTVRITHGLERWAILFQQTVDEIPVQDAMLTLLLSDSGRLTAFGSSYYPDIELPDQIVRLAEATLIARGDVPFDTSSARYTREPETVILPLLDTSVTPHEMRFHLAHRVDVPTRDPQGLYATWVDATSGAILQRENMERNSNYSGHVKGDVEIDHPCDGPIGEDVPLENVIITVGGVADTTDAEGYFNITADDDSFTVRLKVTCSPKIGPVIMRVLPLC